MPENIEITKMCSEYVSFVMGNEMKFRFFWRKYNMEKFQVCSRFTLILVKHILLEKLQVSSSKPNCKVTIM